MLWHSISNKLTQSMNFLNHLKNRKRQFVSNNITIIKTRFQNFFNSLYLAFFHLALCFPIYYMQTWRGWLQLVIVKIVARLCLFLFGNLFAYVAALFVTSVCRLLTIGRRENRARDSKSRCRRFEPDTWQSFDNSRRISIFFSYFTL